MKIPQKLIAAAKPFKLSRRELETLALLAIGEPWKSIASQLTISVRTVRAYAENICRKVGSPSTVAALAKLFLGK